MGAGETLAKSLGFNPTETSREKEMNQTVLRQESWAAERKADIGEKYRIARIKKDPNALKDLMAEVRSLNRDIRSRGLEKLVPLTSVAKVIQSSKQSKTKKMRREQRYKAAEL